MLPRGATRIGEKFVQEVCVGRARSGRGNSSYTQGERARQNRHYDAIFSVILSKINEVRNLRRGVLEYYASGEASAVSRPQFGQASVNELHLRPPPALVAFSPGQDRGPKLKLARLGRLPESPLAAAELVS